MSSIIYFDFEATGLNPHYIKIIDVEKIHSFTSQPRRKTEVRTAQIWAWPLPGSNLGLNLIPIPISF